MTVIQDRLIVVGDKFQEFQKISGVTAPGRVLSRAARPASTPVGAPATLELGQGLSAAEVSALVRLAAEPPHRDLWRLTGVAASRQRCSAALVHKQKGRNVMITEPVADGEHRFVAELLLDDDCDEMADHVTGYHLQGTVLGEAARQMVLAVSEAHLVPPAKRGRMRFVTHASSLSYHTYAFPLDVGVSLALETLQRGVGGSFSAKAALCFTQHGAVVADGSFRFSVFDAAFLDDREAELAEEAVRSGNAEDPA